MANGIKHREHFTELLAQLAPWLPCHSALGTVVLQVSGGYPVQPVSLEEMGKLRTLRVS